jgi:Tol biopolymer transport system component
LALVAGSAAPTQAAFPGRNGRIVFDTMWGYWNGSADRSQIVSVRADGTRAHQLTNEPAGFAAWHPAVSPDGRRITFVLSRPDHNDEVWIMRSDGSRERLLVREPRWVDTGPGFTANGHRIVYSRCGAYVAPFTTCHIVSVRLDGSHRRTVIGGRWHPSDPVASPDGSRIAYVSDAGGYDARIWIAHLHGGRRHAVGPTFGVERLSWCPDGRHLVFTAFRNGDVFTMRTNGSRLRKVAPHSLFGACSPDGARIVYKHLGHKPVGPLRTSTTDGRDPADVVPSSYGAGYADWAVRP